MIKMIGMCRPRRTAGAVWEMDGIVHSFLDIFAAFELFPVCVERPAGVPGERSAPLIAAA